MNDDKVVNLEEYRKERNKGTPIPTLKAFLPDECYIFPEMGLMIHVLFVTDRSIHYDEDAVYVMEDQYGNFFADVVGEETCDHGRLADLSAGDALPNCGGGARAGSGAARLRP